MTCLRKGTFRWVIHNALYWLEEFCFDGLRLDAVHALVDDSERHILTELAERVRGAFPERLVHLVLENEENDVSLLRRPPPSFLKPIIEAEFELVVEGAGRPWRLRWGHDGLSLLRRQEARKSRAYRVSSPDGAGIGWLTYVYAASPRCDLRSRARIDRSQ